MKNDNIRTSVPVRHPGRVLLAVPWCQGPVGLHPVEPRAVRHRRSTLSPSEAILIAWHSGFFSSRFSGPTLSIGRRLQVQDGGTHRHATRRKGFSKGLFELDIIFQLFFQGTALPYLLGFDCVVFDALAQLFAQADCGQAFPVMCRMPRRLSIL